MYSKQMSGRVGQATLLAILLGCAGQICSVSGFISSASIRITHVLPETRLFAPPQRRDLRPDISSSYIKSGVVSHERERRMSHEEQQELLRKSVEMRRIRQIQSDLSLRSGGVMSLTITLSQAAGYGEELDLFENAISDGEFAREALVTGNMGLVHFCVNDILNKQRYTSRSQLRSLSKEDLVQEGAIGLARAIDRWNPEIGGKFSTYAVYWIRAAVLRCIAERDDFVRVPEHVSAAVRKVTRAAKTLGLNIDEHDENFLMSPHWKEAKAAKALAEEAGLTDRQLLEAMKVRERRKTGILSFESWMQKKKHYETDLVSPAFADRSSSEESILSDSKHLKTVLGKYLRPKEIEALSWRYGLNDGDVLDRSVQRDYVKEAERDLFGSGISASISNEKYAPVRGKWGEAMSFSEVGNKMQVSAEYGRKLCHAALAKLQNAAEEGALEFALLV